jgi:SAM-dependent methyltransferase
MADWNAERYHEISSSQQAWGLRLLERLPLAGTEHVLDLGCATGRLTEEIHRRVPAPTPFAGAEPFQQFITNVCVRHHLSRLPADERKICLRELTMEAAAGSPRFTLDYWRLNMSARRPA